MSFDFEKKVTLQDFTLLTLGLFFTVIGGLKASNPETKLSQKPCDYL